MLALVGRKQEQAELEDIYASKKAEFTLVYGRRRIGKTFLIKQFFKKKKRCVFFYVTGVKDGTLGEQLKEFSKAIGESFYHGATIETPETWMRAFEELNNAISTQSKAKKIVLFMDEFPWMATKKSRLIQALEYYWNRYWSDLPNVKLIICGSSAAWIIKKILYQKGGLHNRTTRQIILRPFNLTETKLFLSKKNIKFEKEQVLQIYLALGGVPFYLEQLKKSKSAAYNINNLCFKESGLLFNELDKLFKSLFENYESYLFLIKIIGHSNYGISRSDIENESKKLFHGGRLTERLNDLEMAGFIKSFLPIMHERRGLYYRIIDEFCCFYLKWIEPEKSTLLTLDHEHHYWNEKLKSPSYQAWSGYAFEMLCYKHVSFIKKALNVLDDAKIGSWKYVPKIYSKDQGAQIDIVFDQSDSIILCEIKYTDKAFSIDKNYAEQLSKKTETFKRVTKTDKQIFLAIISANGIKANRYSDELISDVVTLDDLG